MPLLRSLFCFQGADNTIRFISITLIAILVTLLATALFPSSIAAKSVVSVLATIIVALSTWRRVRDWGRYAHWIWVHPALFFVTAISYSTWLETSAVLIFAIPVLSSLSSTLTKHSGKHFNYGYTGPIDLSPPPSQPAGRRVEPSFTGENIHHVDAHVSTAYEGRSQTSSIAPVNAQNSPVDIKHFIENYKKQLVIGSLSLSLAAIIIFLFSRAATNDVIEQEATTPQTNEQASSQLLKNDELQLPDNYSLFLTQYQGLAIEWLEDVSNKEEIIWSIDSAEGERTCQHAKFNSGQTFRPFKVENINGELTAYFSPLDTQAMLQLIAFKSSFKLCDQSFSLKGSQKAIGKHPAYTHLVEY